MKLVLFFSLAVATLGFSPSSIKARSKTTSLLSASSFGSRDGWSDKPAYQPRSTTPVADKKVGPLQRALMEDVMIEPNYFLTWALAILGGVIMWYHPAAPDGSPSVIGVAGGSFHILFAALLWVQTRRVRCVFEKDGFEFYNIKGPHLDLDRGAWLEKKPDNYVSGTRNRWSYDKITNYGFFPSLEYPVICYFKETETPKEQWNKWFAAFDSYGRGQPHFFPGICNVHQFKEQMEKRGVKRKPIPTMKKHYDQK